MSFDPGRIHVAVVLFTKPQEIKNKWTSVELFRVVIERTVFKMEREENYS